MSAVDLTPAGTVRVLRAQLAAAGLPTDDRTVVEFIDRVAARQAARAAQVRELRGLFAHQATAP